MATGSIHFTDLTGDHVMDLVVSDVAQQNIIEQATVFPQGLMFASLSGALSDSSASLSVSLSPSDVSSTSSTAMEIGKLFVWVR